MPQTRGYQAWVEMGGLPLPEYGVEGAVGNSEVTCYIPCEAEKEFKVHFVIPREKLCETNHTVSLYLDGQYALTTGSVVFQNRGASKSFSAAIFEQYGNLEKTSTRSFQFGTLQLTDDDSYLRKMSKKFGEITLEICGFTNDYFWTDGRDNVTGPAVSEDYTAHERAKKGLAHCVKFGTERPRLIPDFNPSITVLRKTKICSFTFKYRHRDLLVAEGIAPPSIIPNNARAGRATSPRKRKAGEMEDGEEDQEDNSGVLEEKEREIQKLKAQISKLKAREAKRIRLEVDLSDDMEVVDLTL
ncbi:hypothetical protein D9611_002037 [Ephemerocybe angulata]|uniref:DUF7918 domain-containing protein n=1 Tax=Ephemerocybe angulata TaxID=980116 RepID=A0A8H5CJU6_9AGAR|nr:hypothetical protein D9611_002037 [Tulosesus angulatus]